MSENYEYDFSQKQEEEIIANGEYECVIDKVELKEDEGHPRLNINFKIRDDIDQPYKGRIIFDTVWEDRNKPGTLDNNKLGRIIYEGQDRTNPNVQTKFHNLEEIIQYLTGLEMRIKIKQYTSKSNGKTYAQPDYNGYMPTKIKATVLNSTASTTEQVDIDGDLSDDLPF